MPRAGTPYEDAVAQGLFWTPRMLRPAVKQWFSTQESPITAASGVLVQQIDDLSGFGNHMVRDGAGTEPSLLYATINGRKGLDSPGKIIRTSSAFALGSLAEFEVAGVFRLDAFTGNFGRVYGCYANSNDYDNTNSFVFFCRNGTANSLLSTCSTGSASTSITMGAYMVARMQVRSGVLRQYINGTLGGSASGLTPALGTVNFSQGRNSNAQSTISYQTTGEMLFVAGRLTDRTAQKLEGYLAWKWGLERSLAAGHPFRSTPPIIGA